jgi:hypothetical protein
MADTAATSTRATRLRHGERHGAQRLRGRRHRVKVRDVRSSGELKRDRPDRGAYHPTTARQAHSTPAPKNIENGLVSL